MIVAALQIAARVRALQVCDRIARRPLSVSRAAIVASVLPDYETLCQHPHLVEHFPTEEDYRRWFVRLMGIFGDPVAGRRVLARLHEGWKPEPRRTVGIWVPVGSCLSDAWGCDRFLPCERFRLVSSVLV